jgi:4'-phosphopantetheinyl transferase EntD
MTPDHKDHNMEDQLAEWLRDTFGGFVGIAVAKLDHIYPLLPGEDEAIARAVERRRIEFSTGRWCAREALKHSGHGVTQFMDPQPILVGPRGAPVWPKGTCGSITHAGNLCAAVAASAEEVEGLGIDVVELREASAALVSTAPIFALDSEVAAAKSALAANVDAANVVAANSDALPLAVLFSAKETAIKAMTESLDRYVEFTEVTITLEPASFSAHCASAGLSVMGWWTECGGYVFTAAARH